MYVRLIAQLIALRPQVDPLDLLRFPAGALAPGKGRVDAWQTRGWLSAHIATDSRDAMIDGCCGQRYTDVKAQYQSPGVFVDALGATYEGLQQTLTVSPNSNAWFPTVAWPPIMRLQHRSRITDIVLREQSLRTAFGTQSVPSTAEVWIDLETAGYLDDLLDRFVLQMDDVVPNDVRALDPTVLIDAHVLNVAHAAGECVKMHRPVLQTVAKWPRALSLLGDRIDSLHDIIVCRTALADRLAAASGWRASPNQLSNGAYAAARLPRDLALSEQATPEFDDCLISRLPEYTATSDAPTDRISAVGGVLRIGGVPFPTLRQVGGLNAIGRALNMESDFEADLLIEEKYCNMLGIDPADMMTRSNYRGNWTVERAAIDRAFERMNKRPIDRRVWYAHRLIWRQKYPRPPKEFFTAVQERYFPGIDPTWKCPDEIADITVDYRAAAAAAALRKPMPSPVVDVAPQTLDGVPTLAIAEAAEQLELSNEQLDQVLAKLLPGTLDLPRITLLETPADPVPGFLIWLPAATPRGERDTAIRQLNVELNASGIFAAEYRASLREPLTDFAVALIRVPNLSDLIDTYQSGSPNGSYEVEAVRQAVTGWNDQYALTILAIGPDSLRLHFHDTSFDASDLIAEIIDVCMDIATYDDHGDLDEVTERLQQTGIIELFWV